MKQKKIIILFYIIVLVVSAYSVLGLSAETDDFEDNTINNSFWETYETDEVNGQMRQAYSTVLLSQKSTHKTGSPTENNIILETVFNFTTDTASNRFTTFGFTSQNDSFSSTYAFYLQKRANQEDCILRYREGSGNVDINTVSCPPANQFIYVRIEKDGLSFNASINTSTTFDGLDYTTLTSVGDHNFTSSNNATEASNFTVLESFAVVQSSTDHTYWEFFNLTYAVPITADWNAPTNGSFYNLDTNNVTFNATVTDPNLDTVIFQFDNSTGTDFNTTVSNLTGYFITSFNVSSLVEGLHTVTIWANDSDNEISSNETVQFTTDFTNPTITFIDATTNSSNLSQSYILTNITFADTNLDTANITVYDINGNKVNSSDSTTSTFEVNFTGFADGNYTINATVNDSANNLASTESREIVLDTLSPNTTVESPLPQAYSTNLNLELNYTTSDDIVGISQCQYTVYNSSGSEDVATTVLSSCEDTQFNVTGSGTYTLQLEVNDTLNNMNETNVTFSVELTNPAVVLNYPTDNLFVTTGSNVSFNFTATDSDGISSCDLYGNWSGEWHRNFTWTSVASGVQNFTNVVLEDGKYKYNIFCNDTSNNEGKGLNNITFTVDNNAPQNSISQPTGTKTSRSNIQANWTITDKFLDDNCVYSVGRTTAVDEVANTTVSCAAGGVTFNVTLDADFTFYLHALDTAGNKNTTTSSFTVDTSGDGGGGGGGGGGGSAPTEEKPICNIDVSPTSLTLSSTSSIKEIRLTNNEESSYDPSFTFATIEGFDSQASNLLITNDPGEILPQLTGSFGVRFLGSNEDIGRNNLILTSDSCADITVPIFINEGVIELVLQELFDPSKNLIENLIDIAFSPIIEDEPFNIFPTWGLFLILFIVLMAVSLNRIVKRNRQGSRGIVLLLIIFMILLSLFLTLALKVLLGLGGG